MNCSVDTKTLVPLPLKGISYYVCKKDPPITIPSGIGSYIAISKARSGWDWGFYGVRGIGAHFFFIEYEAWNSPSKTWALDRLQALAFQLQNLPNGPLFIELDPEYVMKQECQNEHS